MKTLQRHIIEKLILTANSKIRKPEHNYHPKTKDELVSLIKDEVENNGLRCNLNHIDVSQITDMSYLFSAELKGYDLHKFNGTISKWDVSNVKNMCSMFCGSHFNRNISKWDVSKVENMICMFAHNKLFNQDISKWKIKKECDTTLIFNDCYIKREFKPTY